MKRFLIRSAVFIVTFVATVMIVSRILNKDHNNMIMEMPEATLPVMTMEYGDRQYNPLHGYTTAMEIAGQRDCLTILDEDRSTGLFIETYGRRVTGIMAQVRSTDGQRLVEEIPFDGFEEADGAIRVKLALKDLIRQNEEYVLAMQLELDGWQEVWYYTRAIWNPTSHLTEDLNYVEDFHKRLYHREEARELVRYLETNSKLEDNSSYHKVNIHSSFRQVTWGDLQVSEVVAPKYTLKEITDQTASIVVDYRVAVAGENQESNYLVQEYFRVKYTADRMYLLDYERTMTQMPDEENLYAGDKILLGIGPDKVEMRENESGSVVAFAQAGRLFAYNVANQKLALIFSFYDKNHMDDRDLFRQHDIGVLRVSEEGDVFFAVYGYMNRGAHEGEVGLQVSKFNSSLNTVEEILYIPWNQPYQSIRPQMEELLYLNEDGKLYLTLNNRVYRVDLETATYEPLFDRMRDDCMQVSEDGRILVWQNLGETGYSDMIYIRNLETEKQVSMEAGYGEILKIMGFMGEDVIYGAARKDEITRQGSGQMLIPMYKLCIGSAEGVLLKEYSQENIFVTDCRVEENQITLERVRLKENGTYADAGQDHITKTQQLEMGKNKVVTVDIDVYKHYVQIQVTGKIDSEKLQFLTPLEMVREGENPMILESVSPVERFFVYGPYGLDGIYTSMGNAVNRAYDMAGAVAGEDGNTLWLKGKRASRNQIMAITEPEKVGAEESLAACLDAFMRYKGISVSSEGLLEQGKYPLDILRENMTDVSILDMTGCNLDAMLYYINMDIPVLAFLDSGEAVMVTGFNESQVVIYQPSTGKLFKRGMSDAGQWFEENGNCFVTYFP